MTHYQQARSSNVCGQLCLAMLAGVTRGEVFTVVGHRRGTDHKTIVGVAKHFGLRPATKLWQLADADTTLSSLPGNCIIKVRRKGRKNWHWICKVDGVVHDPSEALPGVVSNRNPIVVSYMEFVRCRK